MGHQVGRELPLGQPWRGLPGFPWSTGAVGLCAASPPLPAISPLPPQNPVYGKGSPPPTPEVLSLGQPRVVADSEEGIAQASSLGP